MGTAASMPAVRRGAWEAGITHAQRVTRLYRAHLRNSRDWIIDRNLWLEDARKIRKTFHGNKHKSIREGEHLAEKGMDLLFQNRHPEPYIPIYASGSSKYQRNVPPPIEVRTFAFLFRAPTYLTRAFCAALRALYAVARACCQVSGHADVCANCVKQMFLPLNDAISLLRDPYRPISRIDHPRSSPPRILRRNDRGGPF